MRGRKDPMHFEYTGIKPKFEGGNDQPASAALSDKTGYNLGNIRASHGGFRHYRTEWQAAASIARLIQSYTSRFGAGTIRAILSHYSPPNENPTGRLIANMARRTGFKPDEHLDLSNKDTMAKL